jgi:pimeloyl-ACP methyl ester carboxylesterase
MFADDVLEYLDVGREKKVNFFGYSMGGYVALYLARYHPEKIGKILTLATKVRWDKEIAQQEVKMLDVKKMKEKIPAFASELAKRHAPENWETVAAKTAEMMLNLGDKNTLTLEDFSHIEQEVMVGVGDRDKMVTLDETTGVYKKLKNGRLLVLPNTPHPLEQVNLERLEYEIRDFLS